MPLSPLHKQQRAKNIVLLVILLVMMGIMVMITMIRFQPHGTIV